MYCHNCLNKIHFWESRAEGRHVKCLPIEGRCKYYHTQRDITMSAFFTVIFSITVSIFLIDIVKSIEYINIGIAVFIFLFCNFVAYRIRKKEEEERKNV